MILCVVKVGAALISFLLDTARTDQDTPAFQYSKKLLQKGTYKRVGILRLDNDQFMDISGKERSGIAPRFLPMLIPPRSWDNKKQLDGCYFVLRSSLMRTVSKVQTEALTRANMGSITEGLDYLGKGKAHHNLDSRNRWLLKPYSVTNIVFNAMSPSRDSLYRL